LYAWGYDQQSILAAIPWAVSDTLPTLVLRPYWFDKSGYVFSEAMVSGDFNGDGHPDLIVNFRPAEQYATKGEVCAYFGGCILDTTVSLRIRQLGTWTVGSVQFGAVLANIGDVNGDGYDDLHVGHGNSMDTTSFVYYGGPSFDSIPDLVLPDHTERTRAVGDLNGDGYDDFMSSLAIESSSFSYVKVYYGGPNVDSIPDMQIT
jgi:hypothetical protein